MDSNVVKRFILDGKHKYIFSLNRFENTKIDLNYPYKTYKYLNGLEIIPLNEYVGYIDVYENKVRAIPEFSVEISK